MPQPEHDVVIVGGGSAGVSAALECSDIQLDVVLLEAKAALGGQLAEISHPIRNVATGTYGDGADLGRGLRRAADHLADRLLLNHQVSAADLDERWVQADGTRFRWRALVIASGSVPQSLAAVIDGSLGGDVTYSIERDADRFRGRPVVVVGGGDSATLDALALAPIASSVILAHRSASLTARNDIVADVMDEPRIEDLPNWEVESVHGSNRLEQVVLVNAVTGERRTIAAGGLVVKISRDPCTEVFRGQIDLDPRGFIVANEQLAASRAGVFAAGDVVSGSYWRVSNAVGQGSLVSRTILRYLQAQA